MKRHILIRSKNSRRGVLSMELLMTLPIFLVLLFGLLEYSLLFFAQADVTDAARQGARQAVLRGTTHDDVEAAVLNSLGPKYWTSAQVDSQLGQFPGDEVIVQVRVPMGAASPDLLWIVGFGLRDQYLAESVRMTRE